MTDGTAITLPGFLDRYPFNSPWLVRLVTVYGLPFWFAIESVMGIVQALLDTRYIFFDARLYIAATRAWLDGADPWHVHIAGNYFAAPPPMLLPLVPFALLPPEIAYLVLSGLCIVGAVATIRLLHLPWWWILFPPLVQSVLSGNVQALLVPLILLRLGWLAALLKIYAAVPVLILSQLRQLLILAVIGVASLTVLPWGTFLADLDLIGSRLSTQNENGLPTLVLVALSPLILASLWLVGRERGAWLAVPAMWPAQQFYYGTLVLPAKSKIAAAIVALPVAGAGTAALFVVALLSWRDRSAPEVLHREHA